MQMFAGHVKRLLGTATDIYKMGFFLKSIFYMLKYQLSALLGIFRQLFGACLFDNWKPSFLPLTGVHFRGEKSARNQKNLSAD